MQPNMQPNIYSEEYWKAYAQAYYANQYPRFNMMQQQYNMPINPYYFPPGDRSKHASSPYPQGFWGRESPPPVNNPMFPQHQSHNPGMAGFVPSTSNPSYANKSSFSKKKHYKPYNLPKEQVANPTNYSDLVQKLTHEYYSYYSYPFSAWSSYRDQDIQEILDLQSRISVFRKMPYYLQFTDEYGCYYFMDEKEIWNHDFDNIMNQIEKDRG